MKRIRSYFLYVAVFFAVTGSLCIYIPIDFNSLENHLSASPVRHNEHSSNYYLSQPDLPISPGNEQVRNIKVSASGSGRIVPLVYSFSIFRSSQLNYQKFSTAYNVFGLYYSLLQSKGYYLFYLQKLLI